jgi:hypothetical protein
MRKTASRDGAAPIVVSPLEFMWRIAVLVSHPRLYL